MTPSTIREERMMVSFKQPTTDQQSLQAAEQVHPARNAALEAPTFRNDVFTDGRTMMR